MHARVLTIPLLIALALMNGCSERRFKQNSASAMSPTIAPNETVIANMSAFKNNRPQRWDVVVFHPPQSTLANPEEFWIMRVVGLPGESLEIREGAIFIDGVRETQPKAISTIRFSRETAKTTITAVEYPYKIPADGYFLLGDNVENSYDSRFWGAIPLQNIEGKVKDK